MQSAFFLFLFSLGLHAQKPQVAAHRGKAFGIPENTVRGIQKLLPSGIKYIEIDVRTSKDGRLLIMHDGSLKRTTNSKARVKHLTWHELQQVRISGWLNIRFRNNRIPSLEEVCGVVSGWNSLHPSHPVYLYVDCKEADPRQLLDILQRHRLDKESVFYGGDTYLAELRKLDPELKIMPGLKSPEDLYSKAEVLQPYAFDVSYSLLTAQLVQEIHSRGILVFSDLLFLNDRRGAYKKARAYGVDVIQTDKAKKVLRVLAP